MCVGALVFDGSIGLGDFYWRDAATSLDIGRLGEKLSGESPPVHCGWAPELPTAQLAIEHVLGWALTK